MGQKSQLKKKYGWIKFVEPYEFMARATQKTYRSKRQNTNFSTL